MNLNSNQLDTLRHMLGINDGSKPKPEPYRNYAAVPPGDTVFAALEKIGAVECYRRAGGGFDYDYFRCTDAGMAAARTSFRSIRQPKARRVYLKFLDVSDAISDLTFKEFLTSPEYAETRRAA